MGLPSGAAGRRGRRTLSLCSLWRRRSQRPGEGQEGPPSQGQKRAELELEPQADPQVSTFLLCHIASVHTVQMYMKILFRYKMQY